jgi:hypothetical protein
MDQGILVSGIWLLVMIVALIAMWKGDRDGWKL